MNAEWIARHVIPAAYSVLPDAATSERATAMLLAIGWQESRFTHRRQVSGPARGFWQFEFNGVRGVMLHTLARPFVTVGLTGLRYSTTTAPVVVHHALEHNDVLAACFARALLWTLPQELPGPADVDGAWSQYLDAWRPGKPHEESWTEAWRQAWATVRLVGGGGV